MSQSFAPAPQPGHTAQAPLKGNGFGTAALVLGILALVFSFIPVAGVVAFILGPVAVILGVVGLTRKLARKGTSIAGVILGAGGGVVAIIITVVVAAAVSSVDKAVNQEHQIEYVVTTTGAAHVSYWSGGGTSTEDITAGWKKTVTAKGFDVSSLIVTGDVMNATQVSCEILVDGASVSKNSGTGTAATASCTGSTSGSKK